MAAKYEDKTFDTPLLAQWAAFFDLAGWEWTTNIMPIGNWKPDFLVNFDCGHSECAGSHTILVSVLSVEDISGITGHPALDHSWQVQSAGKKIADAGAVFGSNPKATSWEMAHGAGGGVFDVPFWVENAMQLWNKAARMVR